MQSIREFPLLFCLEGAVVLYFLGYDFSSYILIFVYIINQTRVHSAGLHQRCFETVT